MMWLPILPHCWNVFCGRDDETALFVVSTDLKVDSFQMCFVLCPSWRDCSFHTRNGSVRKSGIALPAKAGGVSSCDRRLHWDLTDRIRLAILNEGR